MPSAKDSTTTKLHPSKSLLNRIDIGLTTGVCAVFISFLALIVGKKEIEIALEAHKATILPIINIDMGYVGKKDERGRTNQHYQVKVSNVGAGIAHIQEVIVTQHGKALTEYKDFESAIMTGRMRGWASVTEAPASGYLRAGETLTPVSYRLGAGESDLSAYLRGKWGVPMDNLDVSICYCSILEDCWTVSYLDRKFPKPIKSCGVDDEVNDAFQNFIDQRFKVTSLN